MQVFLFLLGLFVVLFLLVRKAIMDCDNEGGSPSSFSSASNPRHDFIFTNNMPGTVLPCDDDSSDANEHLWIEQTHPDNDYPSDSLSHQALWDASHHD